MARARKEITIVNWLGHEDARARLAATVAGNRTAHAYLISGPEGIGKSAVAVEFARLLLCEKLGETLCGVCPQCAALKTLHHPDLHLIAPTGSPKDSDTPGSDTYSKELSKLRERLVVDPYTSTDLAEFASSESKSARRKSATGSKIRVADSRELLHMAYRRPFQARQSVYVILNADAMLREAQNALLKLLEEPPTSAILLLTASNLQAVLPTVRSRCQPVKLMAYSAAEVRAALNDAGIPKRAAELAGALSGGNMRRAIAFAEMEPEFLEQAAVDFLATSALLIPDKVQEQVDKLLEDSTFLDNAFFELMTLFLSDAASSNIQNAIVHFPSQRERIAKMTAAYPNADFKLAIEAVDKAANSRSLGYTPNLVLTSMAIELNRALGQRVRA
jgi:DNA polymerase-3 subunit delta'